MSKFVFWNVLHQHVNVALTEDLSHYARGETFWQAVQSLCETLETCPESSSDRESDLQVRLRMYHETGINRVEIFVDRDGDRFAVRCANTRSFIAAETEQEALARYVAAKSRTSVVNTGEIPQG